MVGEIQVWVIMGGVRWLWAVTSGVRRRRWLVYSWFVEVFRWGVAGLTAVGGHGGGGHVGWWCGVVWPPADGDVMMMEQVR